MARKKAGISPRPSLHNKITTKKVYVTLFLVHTLHPLSVMLV